MQVSCKKNDIAYRNYGDISVVYNLINGTIVTLENVAADIWDFIFATENTTIEDITNHIAEVYDCDIATVMDDMHIFVAELFENGIVLIDGNYIEHNSANTFDTESSDIEGELLQIMREKGQLFSATLELTYACNEKCVHCYANYPECEVVHTTVSLDEYKKVIEELFDMGCIHLSLTGGDPFMNKDFLEIYCYARKKGFVCDIYTNGLYLAEHAEILDEIVGLNPRVFYISLYGSNADTHDRVTTVKGSFDKTLFTIKQLQLKNVPVVLNVMLLSVNYTEAEAIISLADRLGVQYRVGMSLIYKNDGSDQPMNYFINDKEKIKSILRVINKNLYSFDQPVMDVQKGEYICGAGTTAISISPEGVVYPCISLKTALGNVHSSSIYDIWNGEKRKALIHTLRWENTEKCTECSYFESCPHCVGISEAESGSMYKCNTCDRMIAECIYEIKEDNDGKQ